MSSTSFYDLYPDILFEIFQYFSLNDLFDLFIDIIPYLPTLLNDNHLKLSITQNANEHFWTKILPQINSQQILSIHTSHQPLNLSHFSFLHSLNIEIQSSNLFEQIQTLVYLERLTISLPRTILETNIWLQIILSLPNLRKLKINLLDSTNILTPQHPININDIPYQSTSIKYLEIKFPLHYQIILHLLSYFPHLQIFRCSLYHLLIPPTLTLSSRKIFPFLQTFDLQGYIPCIHSIVSLITSSFPNLKRCRLIAMNVTEDDPLDMMHALIWKNLFRLCSHLFQVKIHLIMSIERNNTFNKVLLKDLLRIFNQNEFCQKYHLHMEQISINRGYITLIGNYRRQSMTLVL